MAGSHKMIKDNLTACITTYKRPYSLRRLQQSIRKFYPNLPTLIEDTGGNVSAARNRLAVKCRTPFYLMLEDDFVFTKHTKLEPLLDVVESNPKIAGAGGSTSETINETTKYTTSNRGGQVWWGHDFTRIGNDVYIVPPHLPLTETPFGTPYQPCEIILNFGVFRTDVLRDIQYNEDIPIGEHEEYFYRVYLHSKYHFAYVPSVDIDHIRDRPTPGYRTKRNRNFENVIFDQVGVRFSRAETPPRLEVPNVILLTVGRSNSSITTRMAAEAFGYHLIDPKGPESDFDYRYYEHRSVRDVNDCYINTVNFPERAANRILRSLPQPWILKDPRFKHTLPKWEPLLARYNPLLLYVPKNPKTVKESFTRESWRYCPKDRMRCARLFAEWKGAKVRVPAERIAAAVSLFDLGRVKGEIEIETREMVENIRNAVAVS